MYAEKLCSKSDIFYIHTSNYQPQVFGHRLHHKVFQDLKKLPTERFSAGDYKHAHTVRAHQTFSTNSWCSSGITGGPLATEKGSPVGLVKTGLENCCTSNS